MAREWSVQQSQIFNWFEHGNGNLVVRARAGTGKTTTILEAIRRAPESRILLAAFNKRIADELTAKNSNPRAEAKTLHGVGFACVRRYWERLRIDDRRERATGLASRVCGPHVPDAIVRLVAKLHTLGREQAPLAVVADELLGIAVEFDCVPDEQWKTDGFDLDYVTVKALEAMALAADERPAGGIDFADMLFLPIRNGWLRGQYGLVVVDEAQDMTATQLRLALGVCNAGGRVCVVGDDRQAIYGFRGADSGSIDRLKSELGATELGLTVTYRCAAGIVRNAQRLVPDYQHAPHAPEGTIRTAPADTVVDQAKPGDFVLSRRNAPLVRIALALIRKGERTKIEGRDIGSGLRAIVTRLAKGAAAQSIPAWFEKLEQWRAREIEIAERAKLESKVELVSDQFDTLVALADGVASIAELLSRIESIFADVAVGGAQIVCSSVHRAKGLEAERVFMLRDTFYLPAPCGTCGRREKSCRCDKFTPSAKHQQEEANLEYVAVTRAKNELVILTGKFGESPAVR